MKVYKLLNLLHGLDGKITWQSPNGPGFTAIEYNEDSDKTVKLIIDNFPAHLEEECMSPVHPHYPERGLRRFPITRELWIEREDFMIDPVKGYFRLFPGNRVRLRYGYVVECTGYDQDENGNVTLYSAK